MGSRNFVHSLLWYSWLFVEFQAHDDQQVMDGDEVKTSPLLALRPVYKIISDNQDISRTAMQLHSIVMATRTEIAEFLGTFHGYDELWKSVSWRMTMI